MKIAIVNDLRMAVECLRRVVGRFEEHEIIWTAADGEGAVQKCKESLPDLILMDLIMPVMNGVEASRRIMEESPCAILIVTASVSANTSLVYDAMGYGALDATKTPIMANGGLCSESKNLLQKIDAIAQLIGKKVTQPVTFQFGSTPKDVSESLPHIIAIGASTGGPQAVALILNSIETLPNAAIVLIQHIDAEFATGYSEWLNQATQHSVEMAANNGTPEAGKVYLADSIAHLRLNSYRRFIYDPEPASIAYRPSVNVFFHSLASLPVGEVTGVLLTGMGADGAEGLLSLKNHGQHTIAQNQESCIVYGMPKAAVELNAVSEILPLNQIGPAIRNCMSASTS